MRDSPNDENTIIEVLCAFIRAHAALPAVTRESVPTSPVDVRAPLMVLGRRPDPGGHTYLDFSDTLGADLRDADLYAAKLSGTEASSAILTDVRVECTEMDDSTNLPSGTVRARP